MSRLMAEHLSGGYEGRPILRDVCFTVEAGEFCALLGLNGCGKTTLIRSVWGLAPLLDGRRLVDGEDCALMNERQRALRMAYIPQRGSPLDGRSALEVVLMGFNPRLRLLESPSRAMRRQAEEALAGFGLEGQADYSRLSEGQRQLVILARTLVQNAPVLLMDEPDSALDFVNRHMVLGRIRDLLKRQGKAGLIALHDPNFALAYCDRLLLMGDGTILQSLPLEGASRETVEAALSRIYGCVRVLTHDSGFFMVKQADA